MNLLHCLPWRRPAPQRARHPVEPDWVGACAEVEEARLDGALLGCGWFDSSHDLNAGLQVTEHLTPEPVANELPLGWWLNWQLRDASALGGSVRPGGRA